MAAEDPDPLNEAEQLSRLNWELLQQRYSPEFTRWPELLDEHEMSRAAAQLIEALTDDYYERGAAPNSFMIQNQIIIPARGRVKVLRENMADRRYDSYSEMEKTAGLRPGLYFRDLPHTLMFNPGLSTEGQGPDGKPLFWTLNGTRIGLYQDNENLNRIMNLPENARVIPSIGIETTPEQAREKREALAREIEYQVKVVGAVDNIMQTVHEQDLLSGDVNSYVNRFGRAGKMIMRGHHYAEILNMKETREGLAPLGEKIQTGYKVWRDIIAGRAGVEFDYIDPATGETKTERAVLLNPFALDRNKEYMDFCIEYVAARINQAHPIMTDSETLQVAQRTDNRNAALLDLILLDHWDEDSASAIQLIGKDADLTSTEAEIAMEGSFNDRFKLDHALARRQSELRGFTFLNPTDLKTGQPKSYREHPRDIGARSTVDALPRLTTHMLDMVSVKVQAINVKTGKTKMIDVTLDQLFFGARDETGSKYKGPDGKVLQRGERVAYSKEGKRLSRVCRAEDSSKRKDDESFYEYELRPMSDRRVWDSFQIKTKSGQLVTPSQVSNLKAQDTSRWAMSVIKSEFQKQIEIVPGTNSSPYEVPNGLFAFYALSVFNEFTRSDFPKQRDDYLQGDALRGLSKKINVATKALANAYQLSGDTVTKLEEYLRITLIAGVLSQLVREPDEGKGIETQVGYAIKQTTTSADQTVVNMENTLFATRFVRTDSTNLGGLSWADPKDRELFHNLIDKRNNGPYSPYRLPKGSESYFTESQLEELKPLYYR